MRFGDSKRESVGGWWWGCGRGGGGESRRRRKEGMGSTLEDEVEIAMLFSTRVILGLRRASKGEDGVRAEDGERSNLRVVRVRIEVPSD